MGGALGRIEANKVGGDLGERAQVGVGNVQVSDKANTTADSINFTRIWMNSMQNADPTSDMIQASMNAKLTLMGLSAVIVILAILLAVATIAWRRSTRKLKKVMKMIPQIIPGEREKRMSSFRRSHDGREEERITVTRETAPRYSEISPRSYSPMPRSYSPANGVLTNYC